MHTGCTVVHMSVDASRTDSMFMVGSRLDYYSTRYLSNVYMYVALLGPFMASAFTHTHAHTHTHMHVNSPSVSLLQYSTHSVQTWWTSLRTHQ